MRTVRGAAILIVVLAGCAGGAGGMPAPAGDPGPLANGVQLTEPLEIPAGMTVTIPAGAKIVAAPGVVITVRGVLAVASAKTHARIGTAAPPVDDTQRWGGLVVASGGRLDAEGLDLAGAATALSIKAGSAGARYDAGTISDSEVPFQIDAGARLDTAHAAVASPGGASGVNGELHASYLDYQTSPLSGGIIVAAPDAVFDATDSTFHGMGPSAGDFIVSYAARLVHVAYSTVNDAHCAFHFNDVATFQLDHVTAGAASPGGMGGLVVWGAMLYGSGAGPHSISNSNFMGSELDLDQQNGNGPLSITNTYTTGHDAIDTTTTIWLPADVAKAPIADAKPR
jgi:hypothetical protein